MLIQVKRDIFTPQSTSGSLFVDYAWNCFTLEDTRRPDDEKVAGKTCIAPGTYKVVLDWSERFQRIMPHVLDVPHFTGIRIHAGNTAADTEGCILVGHTRAPDRVDESRIAFSHLFLALAGAQERGEEITLEIG